MSETQTEDVVDQDVVEQDVVEQDTETPTTEPETTEPEVFPREYVQQLRDEAAKYRTRAQRADDLAAALWTTRVAATGRLADPTDLPMPADTDPLDSEAVTAAIDELLARKPHLASRRPRGDVGQGTTSAATVDLAGLLRARA
ncbi:hypothetical protein ACFP6A_11535 [Quadrisphaera sp. GCM10027208]|uniref:hypothetical protein n=1 Tax=Quadrisphaera sp. GCM10027208 TaxID=3273423 RepID=UPI003614A85F